MKYLNPKILLLGLAFLALSHQANGQSEIDPVLQRFQGSWQGDGKAFGRNARLQMKWEHVLGNKFVRLSLRNEMSRTAGQTQVFEGHAYYQPVGSAQPARYGARWFDSRGMSFPIEAYIEGDALVSLWARRKQNKENLSTAFLGQAGWKSWIQ
jgi:hypothetical protein